MADRIKIQAKCPACNKSLMDDQNPVDNLESIKLLVKIGRKIGNLYLSQIYGSYNKRFENVDNIQGVIIECSCPHCHVPFPMYYQCECEAPVIGLGLKVGGVIKVCSRNGCKKHWLEFEDADHAFRLFQTLDETGLL